MYDEAVVAHVMHLIQERIRYKLITDKKLDPRPEGLYISSELFPPGVPEQVLIFTIEQVHGNQSVSKLTLTYEHVKELIEKLEGGKHAQ